MVSALGRRIDPTRSSQCSTTSVTTGMYCPVCGVVHIKEPLMLIGKRNPCSGGSGFPLTLSEWSFTTCPTPYNHIYKIC